MDSLSYTGTNKNKTKSRRKTAQSQETFNKARMITRTLCNSKIDVGHYSTKTISKLFNNDTRTSKEELMMTRLSKGCSKDKEDLKKTLFTSKTGLKGNFNKTEIQDDKQTNGSISLELKR